MKNEKISLNAYLATYNRKRNLDKVITKWYIKKYKSYDPLTIKRWDKIIREFYEETEL